MVNIYACLLGEWVNLTTANVVIDGVYSDPIDWYEDKIESIFDNTYVNIEIDGKVYRISPHFIQAVKE